jgi:hypothetical protein
MESGIEDATDAAEAAQADVDAHETALTSVHGIATPSAL